jgi:hypothetical protein
MIGKTITQQLSTKKLRRNHQELHLVLFIALATVDIALVIFFAASAAVMLPFVILSEVSEFMSLCVRYVT